MLRNRLIAACLVAVVLGVPSVAKEDALATITRLFLTSPCVRIEFQEAVHSQVFKEIQTVRGLLVFDSAGRYKIELGDDVYLRNDSAFFSFSTSANQVIIEKIGEESSTASVIWKASRNFSGSPRNRPQMSSRSEFVSQGTSASPTARAR